MRLVVDTNILVSALLNSHSLATALLDYWEKQSVDILTCEEQLDELTRVTRYPKLRKRMTPSVAGLLVNQLREVAIVLGALPVVDASPDLDDNWLFALAQAGNADYIVSDDKQDVIKLVKYGSTPIVTLSRTLELLRL